MLPETQPPKSSFSQCHPRRRRHTWPNAQKFKEPLVRKDISKVSHNMLKSNEEVNNLQEIYAEHSLLPMACDYRLLLCDFCKQFKILTHQSSNRLFSSTVLPSCHSQVVDQHNLISKAANTTASKLSVHAVGQSHFRARLRHCSNCGTLVRSKVDHSEPILAQGSIVSKTSKKGKLRKQLSKMHKTFRSSLGVSTEISEDQHDKKSIECNSSVASNNVSPSHSRSTSNTSRSQFSYNGSDYEGCDVVEYNDSNGKYLVVKQRSIGGTDIDLQLPAPENEARYKVAIEKEVAEVASLPMVTAVDCRDLTPSSDTVCSTSPSSLPADNRFPNRQPSTRLRNSNNLSTKNIEANSHWTKSSSASALLQPNSSLNQSEHVTIVSNSTAPNLGSLVQENQTPEIVVAYKTEDGKLYLPIPEPHSSKLSKQSMRKKKRSSSWYSVLNPSYKQKNEDFHKFFKKLPDTERLLIDYACAWMKDILVQGRMYVSQNYLCFHSNILKWQTALTISLKEIQNITKEKTVKVFPNAIQFQIKGREKSPTFTSFTQRDRAFQQITKLWENALADKPMTPHELWEKVHDNYGNNIGCSSEEEYIKLEARGSESMSLHDGKKVKRKKKISSSHRSQNSTGEGSFSHQQNGLEDQKLNKSADEQSSDDDKTSSRDSIEDPYGESVDENEENDGASIDDDDPAEHCKEDLRRVYLSREFPVSAADMFRTLFGDDCSFMSDFLEGKGSMHIEVGKWESGTDEYEEMKVKRLDYALAINNPLAPKLTKVDETQVCHKETKPGKCYAVDCTARMQGAPYSDYFVTVMRYSIRKINKNTCELRISAKVEYHKTPWGLIKTFIEKNVVSGMHENFSLLERELDEFFARSGHIQTVPALSVPNIRKRKQISTPPAGNVRQPSSGDATSSFDDKYHSLQQNGDLPSNTHTREKDIKAAPTTTPFAVPSDVKNNVFNQSSLPGETKRSKLISILAVAIFSLLLWSNYTMYQRLNSLEDLHSRISSNNFDFSRDPNDIYEMTDTKDTTIVEGLLNLDRRLSRVEALVQDHISLSNERQQIVQDKLNEILEKVLNKGKT